MSFRKCFPFELLTAILILSLPGCKQEEIANFRCRPAKTDPTLLKQYVDEWRLTIGGIAFQDHPTLTIDAKSPATGFAKIVEGSLGNDSSIRFVVAIRPAGRATGEDWQMCTAEEMQSEFTIFIMEQGAVQKDEQILPESRRFKPGVYDARLFYHYMDFISGHSDPVLLAQSQITLLPPEEKTAVR